MPTSRNITALSKSLWSILLKTIYQQFSAASLNSVDYDKWFKEGQYSLDGSPQWGVAGSTYKVKPEMHGDTIHNQIFSVLSWVSGLLLKYLTTWLPAEGFFSISTKEMLFTSIYFTLRQILAAHLSENFTLNTLAQFSGSWIKCRSGELTGYYCPGNSSKAGVRMSCTKDVQHKQ